MVIDLLQDLVHDMMRVQRGEEGMLIEYFI